MATKSLIALITSVGIALMLAAATPRCRAAALDTVYGFGGVSADGALPTQMLAADGNVLYGATNSGGKDGFGVVFAVNTDGTGFRVLHDFTGTTDGSAPQVGPTLVGDTLYGTTTSGANGMGAVYAVKTDGSGFAVLHEFAGDGSEGSVPLDLAVSGNAIYGVADAGGTGGYGTIYRLNPDGTRFTILHAFTGGQTDGQNPQGGLAISGATIYGTTAYGGQNGTGVVYALGTDGAAFSTLYRFTDGGIPQGGLVLGGNLLYGTTSAGGASGNGVVFALGTDGSEYQVLHQFLGTDGSAPAGSLVLNGATLYGAASAGGASGNGTLFQVATDGSGSADLYDFTNGTDGASPQGSPVLIGDTLYGTTAFGGPSDQGTVFGANLMTVSSWKPVDVAALDDGTARVLWTRSDNAMGLWMLSATDTAQSAGPTYGPFTDGTGTWRAQAVKTFPDGTSRVLWTRTDGAAGVWTLDAAGNETSTGPVYGPYTGWSAAGLGISGDGSLRLLWKRTDGAMGLWTLTTQGRQTEVGPTYGPYTGWLAEGIATAADGTSRVLWTRTNGAAGLWSFDSNDRASVVGPVYGPVSGWSATGVGVAADGTARVLWTRGDGAVGLWSFDASDTETTIGSAYGPYSDAGGAWSAAALGTAPDGASRILWNRADGAMGLWTFGGDDAMRLIGSVYGPY